MSSGLSQELKDYIQKFQVQNILRIIQHKNKNNFKKLEQKLTQIVNSLLRGKYDDPYAYIMNEFAKFAQDVVYIKDVFAYELFNINYLPIIKLKFVVEYKQQEYEINTPFLFGISNDKIQPLFDQDQNIDNGKGIKKAITLINEQLSQLLKGKVCQNQQEIDEVLQKFYEEQNKQCINVIQTISYSIPQIISKIQQKQQYEVIRQLTQTEQEQKQSPKILINLLQGSKLVGSKCKPFKFLLLIENYENPRQLFDICHQITYNIKKTICSGKGGEAALKLYGDGTFICTVDTIADNIKMIEEAINKTTYKEKVKIGINFMANNLYLEDKKLYEMENPKQLLDVNQLIEFYLKLCNDRPIIGYIQDPIKSDDIEGWLKLKNKFTGKNIYISSSFLYNSQENIQKISILEDQQTKPDLSQQQINELNNKKFDLDCCHYRPFDFSTLSEFLELAKLANNKQNSTAVIVQDNFEEFDDVSLIDIAFGLRNAWINLPSPQKLERLLKYNRLMELLQIQ